MMRSPVHPGEILREDVLAELNLPVGEAAARLGISRVALSRVLRGRARISPNLAVRLEAAGVGTARGWLAMQTTHDLAAQTSRGSPTSRAWKRSSDMERRPQSEDQFDARVRALRDAAQQGWDDVAAGRYIDLTDDEHRRDLQNQVDRRISARRTVRAALMDHLAGPI